MVLKGVIHGKTIELEQSPGLPDGQAVTVSVSSVPIAEKLPPGEGLRRAAGSWSDDPEGLDAYIEWCRQQRKIGRPEIDP